jgi:tetratricopeptide (TPR) repeat protein/predicted ATPase
MDFINGAILGGMLYDLVKYGVNITANVIIEKAKDIAFQWPNDEPTTAQIANDINALGYLDGESLHEYCQRLDDNSEISQRLKQIKQISIEQNSGIINQPIFNFSNVADKAPKLLILPEQAPLLWGRDAIIDQLLESLTERQSSSHLITGMGGVGKTSMCRQLAHQCAPLLNSVIWLDSQSGLQTALQTVVAPRLQIDIEQPNWLALLIDKLNQTSAPAVLFLDNLELAVGQAENSAILRQLKRLNWHLVATARYSLPQFARHHPIEVLPVDHCIQLFMQHYETLLNNDEQGSLNALIALAGRHPLTVELLAKIAQDGGLTVTELLQQVKETGFDLRQLTDVAVEGMHSTTQWQDERQHQLHQHLSQLFQLIDLSADQKNTLSTLAVLPYRDYHGNEELKRWLNLDNLLPLVVLAKKGWLQRNGLYFAVHPVMAHAVKNQITLDQEFLQTFAARFDQAIQPSETQHWIEKTGYIDQLIILINALIADTRVSTSLLMTLAILYETKGQYGEALSLYRRALNIREQNLGPEHNDVVFTIANLGRLYQVMGHYQQALPLLQRALAMQEQKLGSKDPQIAALLNNLGTLYQAMGEHEQALPLMERALTISENTKGAEHPDTISFIYNISSLYLNTGKYEEALRFLMRSLVSTQKTLGPEHPTLAFIFNDLAGIYQIIGDVKRALLLFQSALVIQEKVFGSEHPDVASTLNNLAGLYNYMKDYQKALPLVKRALAIQEASFGSNHPDVATSLNNLGLLYHSLNNEAQAMHLLLRSLAIRETVLGAEHASVKESLHHLAERYTLVGEFKGKRYQAQFLAKLRNTYHWTENEIIEITNVTKAQLRDNLRAAALIKQYQASDHDDPLDDTLFDLFKGIASNASIRVWYGWNENAFKATHHRKLALLFDWLSVERLINTQADIYLLGKLVGDPQAVTILTERRDLNIAYQDSGLALKDQHAKQVNSLANSLAKDIATLSDLAIHPQQLPSLEAELSRLQSIVERQRRAGLAGVAQTTLVSKGLTEHFSSLHIKNYKQLIDVKLTKLSRINLIAGFNNSGKTSLLEAIYLLTKHNDFGGILDVVRRRGKVGEEQLDSQWFYEQLSGTIDLTAEFNGKPESVAISYVQENDTEVDRTHYIGTVNIKAAFDGSALHSDTRIFTGSERHTQADKINILCPSVFSSPFFLNEPHVYASFYRKTVEAKGLTRIIAFLRSEVIEGLVDIRLLDDMQRFSVNDIAFTKGIDLSHYGEGLQRIFFISLLFAACENGVVLIDEFENAIDTTRIGKFAPFIHKLALEFNVQVFLTSHSKECIDAFVNNVPEAEDFAYHALVSSTEKGKEEHVTVREYSGTRYRKLVSAGDVDIRKAK